MVKGLFICIESISSCDLLIHKIFTEHQCMPGPVLGMRDAETCNKNPCSLWVFLLVRETDGDQGEYVNVQYIRR